MRQFPPRRIVCLTEETVERPGWSEIPAVRNGRIVEIKSPLILQPGPAALTDGLDAIVAALWRNNRRYWVELSVVIARSQRVALTAKSSPPRTIPR